MNKAVKINQVFIDHRVAQLEGVDSRFLNNKDKLVKTILEVAKDLNLITVKSYVHQFKPHGLSLILVIAESHFAVHTWPEFCYLHVDVLSCSPKSRLGKLVRVLKKEFHPSRIYCKKISY